MPAGLVKWFNPTKGFGFIAPDDGGKDIFVHLRTVQAAGIASLNEQERVEFVVEQGLKGPQAKDLKVVR